MCPATTETLVSCRFRYVRFPHWKTYGINGGVSPCNSLLGARNDNQGREEMLNVHECKEGISSFVAQWGRVATLKEFMTSSFKFEVIGGDPELIWLDDVVGGDENSPLKGFRPSYQQTSDASLEIRRIFSSDDVAHGWVTILNNVIYITTLDVKRPVRLGDKNDPQDDS